MVTFVGLVKTFQTTKNPFRVLYMAFKGGTCLVKFKNGLTCELDLDQFMALRDHYSWLKEGRLVATADGNWMIDLNNYRLLVSPKMLALSMFLITELKNGEYDADFSDKTVLDVGAFIGDTACYFASKGAKKVVLYEPVLMHHEFIRKNIDLNHVNAEVHKAGIDLVDGETIVPFDDDNANLGGFGLHNKVGNKMISLKLKAVSNVIKESHADIAKFDCEGAEECLVSVPVDVLRLISLFMIEIHSDALRDVIVNKFQECGFTIRKEYHNPTGHLYTIHFLRNDLCLFSS
ncbi:MAG: FkbM family methyltransferase [Candidatus Bathyarchaeum tardum]|nr:MAG: FkbM family methyltransferase [Candidatus Bathyarchaeum tardum]